MPGRQMGEPTPVPCLEIGAPRLQTLRHAPVVRITHWTTTISFVGLVVSGVGILLAHPRFYWGETGALGTPSILDLPLPFMLGGPSGWGRSLHFLSAWVAVVTAAVYGAFGVFTGHFRSHLLPARASLSWRSGVRAASTSSNVQPLADEGLTYNTLQRFTYIAVVFIGFPLMIWTGFAMSPALTSVCPLLVRTLGGQQSARTIHFFAANVLVLFAIVHVAMVWRAGFLTRVRRMTL
jgi:thiosulfate reductase cytochrome b subunit